MSDTMKAIEDARAVKREVEAALTQLVAAALEGFQQRTGLVASSVEVHMLEVTQVHDYEPRYAVSHVTIEVKPL